MITNALFWLYSQTDLNKAMLFQSCDGGGSGEVPGCSQPGYQHSTSESQVTVWYRTMSESTCLPL